MGETKRKSRLRNASSGKATTAEISRERQRTRRKRIAIGAAVGALVAVAAGFACFGPASNANTLGQADKEEPTLAPIVDTTEKVTTSTVTPLEQGAGTEGAAPAAETQGEAAAPTEATEEPSPADIPVAESRPIAPALGAAPAVESTSEVPEGLECLVGRIRLFPKFPDGTFVFPDSDYQPLTGADAGKDGIVKLDSEIWETNSTQTFDAPTSFVMHLTRRPEDLNAIIQQNLSENVENAENSEELKQALKHFAKYEVTYANKIEETQDAVSIYYHVDIQHNIEYKYNIKLQAKKPSPKTQGIGGLQLSSGDAVLGMSGCDQSEYRISVPIYRYEAVSNQSAKEVYPLGITEVNSIPLGFFASNSVGINEPIRTDENGPIEQQEIQISIGNTTNNITYKFCPYEMKSQGAPHNPIAPSNLDFAAATAPDWNGLTCSINGQRYSAFSPSNHNYTIQFGLNEPLPGAPVLGGLPSGYSASVRSFEDAAVNGVRHVVTVSNGRDSQEYSFAYSKVEGSSSGLSPATSDQVSHTGSVPGQVAPTPAGTANPASNPAATGQGMPAASNGVGVESSKPATSQPGGAGSAPTSSAGNAASSRVAQSRASTVGAAPDGSLTQTGDAVTVVAGTTLAAAVVAAAAIARRRSQRVA